MVEFFGPPSKIDRCLGYHPAKSYNFGHCCPNMTVIWTAICSNDKSLSEKTMKYDGLKWKIARPVRTKLWRCSISLMDDQIAESLGNIYQPRSEGVNALGSVHLSVCLSVHLSVCLRSNDWTEKSNKSHYQFTVFVCVSVISGRRRIIVRMRSIGVLIANSYWWSICHAKKWGSHKLISKFT